MKKVAVIMADGFEEMEAINTIDILRRASINVEIIALNNGVKIAFNDGFLPNKESKQLEWNGENPQNVYFLHGAFHILQNEKSIVKIKAEPTTSMLKNIQEAWHNLHPMTHFWIVISSIGMLTLCGLMAGI